MSASNSSQDVNGVRIDMLEKEVGKQSDRIATLEQDRKEIAKIATLLEIQIDMNKSQDKFLRQQSDTLVKINENLTNLNKVTGELSERVDELEGNFQDNLIEGLKKDMEIEKRGSIHIIDLVKKIIVALIFAGLSAWLGIEISK